MKNTKNRLLFLILAVCLVLGVFFFLFLGETRAVEFADSEGYMAYNIRSGVMPAYHFFLRAIRDVSGKDFLQNVVIIQGLFACITTVLFSYYIYVKYELKEWEILIVWVVTLLPYATELPSYVATHVIFTEAICYTLYYYYVMLANEVISSEKKLWVKCIVLFAVSVVMAFTRPQLLLLLGISGCLYAYLIIRKRKNIWSIMAGAMIIGITCASGVILTYGARNIYQRSIENQAVSAVSSSVEYASADDNHPIEAESDFGVTNEKNIQEKNANTEYKGQGNLDQLALALLCRGFFEANEEDVKYYDEGMEQMAFINLYRMCDGANLLHNKAGHGLWAWYGYTNTDIYVFSSKAIDQAMIDSNWYYGMLTDANQDVTRLQMKMGITEIVHHPFAFIYRTIRLMIPGFISCIFFNIRKIYLLCHVYVLAIYGLAIAMARRFVTSKTDSNRGNVKIGRYMFFNLFCCLVFVGTTNLVFYGMQRYFLYLMGVFYIGFYLCVRQSVINRNVQ